MLVRVCAADLQPGDILSPTNREVVRVSRGVWTPTGHVDVDLRRPDGRVQRSTFRKTTAITVAVR